MSCLRLPSERVAGGVRVLARAAILALLQVGWVAPSPDASALTSQTISFAALPGKTFGAAPFAVSATASSGLAVSFVSLIPATCTVATTTVTILGAGTCTIQARQAGNASYAAAPSVNQSLTIAKAAQSIAFAALAGKTYGAAPFAVSALASSGLAVAFVSTTVSVCTVSIGRVAIVAGGTCTITASQAGNGNYLAATSVRQSFAVAKASQTIAFGALASQTFGAAPFTVSATATSGLAVNFTSTTTAVCAVSGSTVTIKTGGTCTIQAAQAGNASYSAALNVGRSFTVAKASQAITLGALASQTFGAAPFTVSATATSGLAVNFTSTTTAVCAVSGSTVTIKTGGTCTIPAAQAGNGSYNAALNVSQGFTVAKAAQAITFGALPARVFAAAPFTVSAISSSGLAVSYASLTTGVCTSSANTITIQSAGVCSIQASQAGNSNFNAAPSISQSFTITAADQTITFPRLENRLVGSLPLLLTATASSGLPVGYSSLTPAICTVTAATAALLGPGTCAVQATQAGNTSYTAAPAVNRSFAVIALPQFAAPMVYMTGTYPGGIAVGDFNGDGKLDVAVANAFSGNVSVLLGNGFGGFTAGTAVQVGGEPTAVATGDFNGDGKVDLAVADLYYNRVFLLSGNGNGTFAIAATINVGLAPIAIAASDFNRDGKIDLVVANTSIGNATGQSVTVVLGSGDGRFGTPTSYPTGRSPYGLVVADFNGDGNQDLAVASGGGNSVSVLLGRGDGTFAPAVDYAAGFFPDGIAAGDLDGDGKLDLAVVNDYGNDVSILLGHGDGTFGSAARFAAGSGPASVAIADFNGDGWNDLAIANRFDNTLTLLLGNGDGTFQPPLAYAVGTQPEAVAAIDLNRDGRIDILVTSAVDNDLAILLQSTGNPTGRSQTITFGPLPDKVYGAAPLNVGASASSGLPVSVASLTMPVCSVAGTLLTIVSTGTCTLRASQPGDATYAAAADVDRSFFVAPSSQSIAFGAIASRPAGGPPIALGATASSGLAVSFASLTPAVCTVNGSLATLAAAGTCTIRAGQPGNANYSAATNVDQSFAVTSGGSQTIVFAPLPDRTFGDGVFIVDATATSGLPVSFSSLTPSVCAVALDTLALVAAGTCTLRAAQAGNASYGAAPNVDRSFIAAKTSQTIAFTALSDRQLTNEPMLLSAAASSGLGVSFGSSTPAVCTVSADLASTRTPGVCTIRASQPGNANYLAAPSVDRSFTIARNGQAIAFANPGAHGISAVPFSLNASSSSGLPIVFTTLTAIICSVNANMATALAAGTCKIRASQAGDANYPPASADQSFLIVASLVISPPPLPPAPPFIAYSTYLGGYGPDKAFDVVVGSDGAAYVGGSVASSNFPGLSSSAFTNAGLDLLFVTRVNPDGGKLDFSTVTGGRAADITGTGRWSYVGSTQPTQSQLVGGGQVEAMAIDAAGNVYVASYANSTDYPVRGGTYVRGGSKTIYKIGPTGVVQAASGAIDPAVMTIRALAVDAAGGIYFTGIAGPGLATTPGALIPALSAPALNAPYLVKLALGGATTAFATYLSAPGRRAGVPDLYDQSKVDAATTAYALAIDAAGNSYLAGQSTSDQFPVTTGSPDTPDTTHRDAFVAKVNATGTALLFVARLGGADAERATGIALSPDGSIVIGGKTATQPFWGTTSSFQSIVYFRSATLYVDRETGFVAKLAADGSKWLFIGTLGTEGGNLANGAWTPAEIYPVKVAVDRAGAIYAAGTSSPDRDLASDGYATPMPNGPGGIVPGGAVIIKISPDGSILLHMGALGGLSVATGLALDNRGNAYVAGYGSYMATVNAPSAAPMYESDFSSAFVAKLNDQYAPVILSTARNSGTAGAPLTLTALVADGRDNGSVEFDDGGQILGVIPVSGGRATLPVSLSVGLHRLHATYRGPGPFNGHSALEVVQSIDQPAVP